MTPAPPEVSRCSRRIVVPMSRQEADQSSCNRTNLLPWFRAVPIFERVGEERSSANRNVHDYIKLLVERGHDGAPLPRVRMARVPETSSIPEPITDVNRSNQTVVDEEVHVRRSPHKFVQMELFIESRRLIERVMRRRPAVDVPLRTEMKSATDLLGSYLHISIEQRTITSAFHQIDLARSWPATVDVESRHHPKSRPNPITARNFRSDFKRSEFESK